MIKEKLMTEFEKEQLVKLIKKGEFSKLGEFLQPFNRNILSSYRANECDKHNIHLEDFYQECYMGVLRAFKSFRGNTYGEVCVFIKTTIKYIGKDLSEKHQHQNNYNVLVDEAEDIHRLVSKNIVYSLENEVVNRLTIQHSNEKFIKNRLTKTEYKVLQVFYFDKCPRKYELENGLKYRSFDKALSRALKKAAKIVGTKEFMDFHFLSIVPEGMVLE